ncbi:MAG TPA: hypothetical protein VK549_04600 [Acidimicrobiia bacterium]|nr:hypothetical protein [Acidimicrobiia bacterium]
MHALRAVVALGLLAAALAACSGKNEASSQPMPSKAFCQAAYDFDTKAPKLIGKVEQQTALVQRMADHAPKDVAKDARTVLDAMQRVSAGDKSVVDKPAIQTALENVERRAINGCALYKQDKSGGGGI